MWLGKIRTFQAVGDGEPPLRSELFSADQMEQHGEVLAKSHKTSTTRRRDDLLLRLAENRAVLTDACKLLAEAIKAERRITPAGEWLLDNFYLIEEQIRTARSHLPKGYSLELPRLLGGPSRGLPRVYDIALETISHGDGRVDGESLSRFIAAYQKITPLKLGELWAIPIMLRLALIENLRRVAGRIATDRMHRNLADKWADQMTQIAEQDPKNLILVIADMARSNPPMASSFVAELARRLQGRSPALALPLTWIQQFLLESGLTIEQLVHAENQQQAAEQVSVSNSVGSLRFLAVMDWREFVESMSLTERTLQQDPDGTYPRMDFSTRDRYRHVVERVAKAGGVPEEEIARHAVKLAQASTTREGVGARAAHVGFYLIDRGLSQLERTAGAQRPLRSLARSPRLRLSLHVGVITLIGIGGAAALLFYARAHGVHGGLLGLTAMCALLCATQFGVAVANRLAIALVEPQVLARMDFSKGIPAEHRSLVIVPTMLTDVDAIERLIEALEVHFLANRDPHLQFGLLTDFTDADAEQLPEDDGLVQAAARGIAGLNEKYASEELDTFFLFHRPRRWNPHERIWMGYERKRGKLGDLNALLRGDANGNFRTIVGRTDNLSAVRFVITLDTDTQLPRDTARQMVATMAHPLNRACYDETLQRVCAGYGILQPRVAVSLISANRTWYARLHTGESGIDPYTRAVSDVYQDLFDEGSFIGKGIYDVDAFERSLAHRFPENRILSHDLLEGCYARSGWLSDVQLYEDYPASYAADVDRRHRWIRGDWQIARWLMPRVPGESGILKNPISALSKLKILDNLRRSLTPAALTLLLLLGWTVLPNPWLWTLTTLGIIMLPAIGASLLEVFKPAADAIFSVHLRGALQSAGRRFVQVGFALACLPHEMMFTTDAFLRTAARLLATHRRLLEWRPSNLGSGRSSTLGAELRSMWVCPGLALCTAGFLLYFRPIALGAAMPILAMWLLAPVAIWWIGRPRTRRRDVLGADQKDFLRHAARRTWGFFETFVGPEDHWLPPDNMQEHPAAAIAHRTSPTNMGLSLLANLAAYDFGYLTMSQLIERTQNSLKTMAEMERNHGHFYNWYDTQSLKPLSPQYISSVDSGNLAAHLLTLRPGLLGLLDQSVLSAQVIVGLLDTYALLAQAHGATPRPHLRLEKMLQAMAANPSASLVDWRKSLAELAIELARDVDASISDEAGRWILALRKQCDAALGDLDYLFPWLAFPAHAAVDELLSALQMPTLRSVPRIAQQMREEVEARLAAHATPTLGASLENFRQHFEASIQRAGTRMALIEQLARQSGELAQMDFGFLYDHERRLFTIGYNVSDQRRDVGYYDLLASEARLTNFVAIAQGQVPQESWFALGRLLTTAGGEPVLLSWGGSMFEYLMPILVMPTYENTLLDQTSKAAVQCQIDYGIQRGVPWGISESGYNTVDAALNYQYRTFGVPGLGLKRGLGDDLVVAPYASVLALMVSAEEACANLQQLHAQGVMGEFGFYEAVDYSAARLRPGQSFAVVKSFMAHHQGISLLSLASLLLDHPMQRRFASDPLFQATIDLLQERIPKASMWHAYDTQLVDVPAITDTPELPVRAFDTPHTSTPALQLLSNGRYHVMISNAGGGYSRWKDLAVTRWREDSTCDNWGTFCYLRDVETGKLWSNTFQPTLAPPDSYEAIFTEPRIEFRRRDHELDTHTDVAVSPEDDIELRRVRIVNRSRTRKTIDVTSYAEVVLAPAIAEELHRVFSNLFVQTEIIQPLQAIICTRRPRSSTEQPPWMFHLFVVHGLTSSRTSYETDRARFIGRRNSLTAPLALRDSAPLSGSAGPVLDPIVAIQHRVALDPDESVILDMVTGVCESRAACLALVGKYQDRRLADRVFDLAWTHSQVALRQINVTEADAQLYGRLAGRVIYANNSLRAEPGAIINNRRGQSGLWGYAISGDLPIVLLQIRDSANIELVRQLVQAHAYWRMKGLAVDLVIWNDDHGGYRQALHDQIMGLIGSGIEANVIDRPGGIFVRLAEQIAPEDRILLQAVARAILSDNRGGLAEQIKRRDLLEPAIPRFAPTRAYRAEDSSPTPIPHEDMILFNGFGGFAQDGHEYVIVTSQDRAPPAPWVNVLSNPNFGTVISEGGTAYTWRENAHEFRLTPWSNDPVSDPGGEAMYLRDEETGRYWSPTPLPACGKGDYRTRHGFGYSVFEHSEDDIRTELWVYVALDAAVKFSVLKVHNASERPRRLSATAYVEWVLGDLRTKSAMHIVTEIDPGSGALLARNSFNPEFADLVAFFDVDAVVRTLSGDRAEFIGRNGTLQTPAAMARARLSGKVGAAMDPCAAVQIPFELGAGQSHELIFRLGVGRGLGDTSRMVMQLRKSGTARAALEDIRKYWARTLGTVQVETPQPALNVLSNGWLLYQTIACRLWGRSGYYQSGGAFGFRDQLQDAMALVHAEPRLLREQLLRCASRQFKEGDVQHWWHPPSGRGVRTHCSDDYLWLPLATSRYVSCTGDRDVLAEPAGFLEGRLLGSDEESYYDLPMQAGERADLYEHCVRAIRRGLNFGAHGLPLMGTGDWNDGMNNVGAHGKGESVWLGFFLFHVLTRFFDVARLRGDMDFAERCRHEAEQLRGNIEQHAWDGAWYRRAYFDDGTPLGSSANPECQIDSIAQSWSVLSAAGDPTRAQAAMNSLDRRLVQRDHALVKLLDPPFDHSALDPGYIKGYLPGVRENGGQYTHAAIWASMAFFTMGEADRAWELLQMINPVNRSTSLESADIYKVEPYVVTADVYAVPPHTGRGGWSWYTGSAGWLYRLIVESMLGVALEADKLRLDPRLPSAWTGCKIVYRYRETFYDITISRTLAEIGPARVRVDGIEQAEGLVAMVDDHARHLVEVDISTATASQAS